MRGRTRRRGVITCNMLSRANSDYMKCLAHVQDFGPAAPTEPREDNENQVEEQRESSDAA